MNIKVRSYYFVDYGKLLKVLRGKAIHYEFYFAHGTSDNIII